MDALSRDHMPWYDKIQQPHPCSWVKAIKEANESASERIAGRDLAKLKTGQEKS
jgi:hypothetical protein